MKTFTAWQYLLIDAANQMGHDKMEFEDRIKWSETFLPVLEKTAAECPKKTLPLYLKAVSAIRKAQRKEPTGHRVGLDACCSGIQVMSAMTGCIAGATATGMVDPDRRADAYGAVTNEMNTILGTANTIPREIAKDAVMTSFYGSKDVPKKHFGEDTPELNAFYEAAQRVAPGAWELLQDLLASWNAYALAHSWKLPDGFDARVKVMVKKEARIEIDELGHGSFTYEFKDNEGTKKGLSNVANLTHSMDAFVLREMHRRCNYNQALIEFVDATIQMELINRDIGGKPNPENLNEELAYYSAQWDRSTLASAVILPLIDSITVTALSTEHLKALAEIVNGMRLHKPFELVTVHDEFTAHANNMNHVRWHYKEIMAEIADSNVIDDLMSQIYGKPCRFRKLSSNLGDLIRGSNYALC